jgi:hypothetical protein
VATEWVCLHHLPRRAIDASYVDPDTMDFEGQEFVLPADTQPKPERVRALRGRDVWFGQMGGGGVDVCFGRAGGGGGVCLGGRAGWEGGGQMEGASGGGGWVGGTLCCQSTHSPSQRR